MVDPDLPALPCRVDDLDLLHGDCCVVETADGLFLGQATVCRIA